MALIQMFLEREMKYNKNKIGKKKKKIKIR